MDAKMINPFIKSVLEVMPQLGFSSVERKGIALNNRPLKTSGVVLMLNVVGDVKGNVVYTINEMGSRKIASTMMMGMPVETLDDMAKSALSELSNMLTANGSINFSNDGINIDISVPTMMYGSEIEIMTSSDTMINVEFDIDGIRFDLYVALD